MMLPLFAFCLHAAVAACLANWPLPSRQIDTGIQSQRDISYRVPLDQTSGIGVSLSSTVFQEGYTDDALDDLASLLDVGFRTIHIDLYWNEFARTWQLCPAPYPTNITTEAGVPVRVAWNNTRYYCQPDFTVNDIMDTISLFLDRTNTNMDVSYLHLLYSLHEISAPSARNSTLAPAYLPAMFPDVGNTSLSSSVSALGSLLFTPADLQEYHLSTLASSSAFDTFYNQSTDAFPCLEDFLFTLVKRVQATIINHEVSPSAYSLNDLDRVTFFVANESLNTSVVSTDSATLPSCAALLESGDPRQFEENALHSRFRFAFDNVDNSFTPEDMGQFLRCGFLPVLSSTTYDVNDTYTTDLGMIVDNFLPASFWSWANGQPRTEEILFDEEYGEDIDQVAFRCVAIEDRGFKVKNCYVSFNYACKNKTNPLDWFIVEERSTYFDAYTNSECPDEFEFGIPQASMEMMSLLSKIQNRDLSSPVWVDLNDITVEDCFVTGGPYAECPYQRVISTTRLAQMLAPACVVAVVVLILLFLQQVVRTNPVHTNRKRYWKKTINDYYKKNDSEGVPS